MAQQSAYQGYQQPYQQQYAEDYEEPRKPSKIPVILLSILSVGLLATLLIVLFIPKEEVEEEPDPALIVGQQVESAALKEGYDWLVAIYDDIDELAELSKTVQANTPTQDTTPSLPEEIDIMDPEAMEQFNQSLEEFNQSMEELNQSMEAAGADLGKSLSLLIEIGILASDDVKGMVDAPIREMSSLYPDVVDAWDAIVAPLNDVQRNTNSSQTNGTQATDVFDDALLQNLKDRINTYKQAVQNAGFDTSDWKTL